uniref:Adhesion G protein-coupled receptor G5 n=1 Tax=Propithecus coquereli TaxID=379532 RepID=A0A2K6G822_PROCO
MDRWGVLFFCLCLQTFQNVTAEASQELLRWMEKMEGPPRGRSTTPSLAQQVHILEQRLLNVSLGGYNLTLQTSTIQSLAFKLGCDFAGLSLSSAALKPVPQVRGGARDHHAMQFPAELTRDACRTGPRELRLICVYFFTDSFFKVSATAGQGGWSLPRTCEQPDRSGQHQLLAQPKPGTVGRVPLSTHPCPSPHRDSELHHHPFLSPLWALATMELSWKQMVL